MVLQIVLSSKDREKLAEFLNYTYWLANTRGGSKIIEPHFEQLWEIVVEIDRVWTLTDEKLLRQFCKKIESIIINS